MPRLLSRPVEGTAVEPAGSLRARRKAATALAPWALEGGRKPGFERPLLCPSLVVGIYPSWSEIEGLPALEQPPEPWIFDARIRIRVPA